MAYKNQIRLMAAGLAGLLLAGCSSSDNLEEWTYATFPVINTASIIPQLNAYTDLDDVEQLAYQAALIYETVLNPHGYDEVNRTLPAPSQREHRKWLRCPIDGRIWYERVNSSGAVSGYPHLGSGSRVMSQVNTFGCYFTDDQEPQNEIITHGALGFLDDEVDGHDVSYTAFANYALQYISEPAVEETLVRRAEIDGYYVEGPIDVDASNPDGNPVGGSFEGDTAVQIERRQRLRYATYVEHDDGTDRDPTIVVIHRGLTGVGGGAFWLRNSPGETAFRMAGPLASASMTEADVCGHGRIDVSTLAELSLTGNNIVAGELLLRGALVDEDDANAGGDEDESTTEPERHNVTFSFAANGDVQVNDANGDSVVLIERAAIDAVRDACFQTVPVRY